MGYLHIDNLYKRPEILAFREVYALEKIHGTSANVSWNGKVNFFAGGASHDAFVNLFDVAGLEQRFRDLGHDQVTVYGEAYGGKMQGMAHTYGPALKFIVFDVKVGDAWVTVPNAESIAEKLGLEFVYFALVPTDIDCLNKERDAPSIQSFRNGVSDSKPREGVVLRPPFECYLSNGSRVIAKHKGEAFRETSKPREVDAGKLAVITQAAEIAEEWVTDMRLRHVLSRLTAEGVEIGIENTGSVVKAMIEDVNREAAGEIVPSREADKAIGKAAANLFKKHLSGVLN